ncbi:DUF3306 domain-containing protein [Roseomonas sp. CAU 1739]|uniref:DUF3306 domain-containing protein n=1 Tax=Roseomonas sp. CAU 1739 TaxID=3140364 RepID=UPI00325B32FD
MSEEGFLSRWSRRKRAVEAGLPPPEPPAAVVPEAAPVSEVPQEPHFDITTLPPIDSLTIDSDIAAFLRKEVPAALQRAALRKAWTLDPAIRDFIGPADYAWDYNAPDGVPGASLDLPGNIREMLAQAFGTPAEDAAELPAPDTSIIEAPPEAPTEEAAPSTPVMLSDVATPEPAAPASSATRRHGSALPS